MSATSTQLRNRFDKAHVARPKSTEELLIEKLDTFLSLIEHRLERFDQYFQVMGDEANNKTKPQSRSRRSSTASLLSLKSFSVSNLSKVQEQLRMVKDQVLKTSVTNLEYLYKILDDKYNDLFSQDLAEEDAECVPTGPTSQEVLSKKIITTIQYFEQKLTDVDQLIKSKTPQATANYDDDAKFNRFRFFNFNKALADAQTLYLHYYQLPLSWRENRYIIYGYRFNLKHGDMLKSMFHFNHNETGNIWTHMVGAVFMLYLGLVHFPSTPAFAGSTWGDLVVMYSFIAAALSCLVSSVLWHTYSCFAQLRVRNRFACVDYTGITVLITCSVISAEYCALYQFPTLLPFFMGALIIAGVGGFLFNWSPHFDRPEYRHFRIGFYICLALLGSTTFLCKWYYEGFVASLKFYSPLGYKSFVWYWIGVVFYGGLFPERWRYDILIEEDETCNHDHGTGDVLRGNVEHSGEEEFQELQKELQQEESAHDADASAESLGDVSGLLAADEEEEDEVKYKEILEKHFRAQPTRTPYADDFLSLWWVDYVCLSHNLWHLFVVFGVVGHYYCIVQMMASLH